MSKYTHSRTFPLSRYGVPIGKLLGSGKVLITQIEKALARRKAVVHWDARRSSVYVEAKFSSDLDEVENVIRRRVKDLERPKHYSWTAHDQTPTKTTTIKVSKTSGKYVDYTGKTVQVVVSPWNLPTKKVAQKKPQGVKLATKWKPKLSKAVALATPAVPVDMSAESDMTLSVSAASEKAESVTTAQSTAPEKKKLSKAQRKRLRAKKARAYRRENEPAKATPQRITPQMVKQQKLEKEEVQPSWTVQKSKGRCRGGKAKQVTVVAMCTDSMPAMAKCAPRRSRIDVSKMTWNYKSSAKNVVKRQIKQAELTKHENAPAAKIPQALVGAFKGRLSLHFDRIKNLCFAAHGVPVAIYIETDRRSEMASIFAKATKGTKSVKKAHASRKMASRLLKARQDLLEGEDKIQKMETRDQVVVQPKLLKPKSANGTWAPKSTKAKKLPVWHRRLLKDLEELETQEFPDLAVHLPNEKDLKTWHVNLRGPEGPMEGCILHLELLFSEAYPAEAPKVRLLTKVPGHPNTFGEYICLDMLKKSSGGKYQGWTPAYSASSLLMQLQSFLCAENVPQELGPRARPFGWSGVDHAKSRASAKTFHRNNACFECSCGHKGSGAKGTVCMPAFAVAEEHLARETVVKCTSLEHVAASYRGDVYTWRSILQFLPADTLFACTRAFVELDRVATRWNMCEAKHVRCYFTKKDIKEAVLGIGILREATVDNYPECIATDGSYISVEAWTQHDVQQGVYGKGYMGENSYNHFLPLAMNAPHFKKAMPYINEALAIIANNAALTPALKLDTICDFLIKVLVQLLKTTCGDTPGTMTRMDMCEAAVQTFCSLHHLLLSYCQAEPKIREVALCRLRTALRPGGMVKSVVPNLGYLMMYQTVVDDDEVSWDQLKELMVEESFLRSHRWNTECHDLTLEPMDRVNKTFHARTTGRRIMLFQFAFVQQLCRKRTWKQNLANYDRHCGSLGRGVAQDLYAELQAIIAKDTWKQYFAYLGVEAPKSADAMAAQLLASMKKSELLKYHDSTFVAETPAEKMERLERQAREKKERLELQERRRDEEVVTELVEAVRLQREAVANSQFLVDKENALRFPSKAKAMTLFEILAAAKNAPKVDPKAPTKRASVATRENWANKRRLAQKQKELSAVRAKQAAKRREKQAAERAKQAAEQAAERAKQQVVRCAERAKQQVERAKQAAERAKQQVVRCAERAKQQVVRRAEQATLTKRARRQATRVAKFAFTQPARRAAPRSTVYSTTSNKSSKREYPRRYRVAGLSSLVDGVYTRNGEHNGYPCWQSSNGRFQLFRWRDGRWYFSSAITSSHEPDHFRCCTPNRLTHNLAPHEVTFQALKNGDRRLSGKVQVLKEKNTF